jgi:hypothetical protein
MLLTCMLPLPASLLSDTDTSSPSPFYPPLPHFPFTFSSVRSTRTLHSPVHLGSMQFAISYAAEVFKGRLKDGDILVSNASSAGGAYSCFFSPSLLITIVLRTAKGTHLPDVTVIMPVFEEGEIVFWVAA